MSSSQLVAKAKQAAVAVTGNEEAETAGEPVKETAVAVDEDTDSEAGEDDEFFGDNVASSAGQLNDQCQPAQTGVSVFPLWRDDWANLPKGKEIDLIENVKLFEQTMSKKQKKADKSKKKPAGYKTVYICNRTARVFYKPNQSDALEKWLNDEEAAKNPDDMEYRKNWVTQYVPEPVVNPADADNFGVDDDEEDESDLIDEKEKGEN
jgi:hypothetical protein